MQRAIAMMSATAASIFCSGRALRGRGPAPTARSPRHPSEPSLACFERTETKHVGVIGFGDHFARKSPLRPSTCANRTASWRHGADRDCWKSNGSINQPDGRLNRSATLEPKTGLGPGLRVGSGLDRAAPESVPNQFHSVCRLLQKISTSYPTRFRAITPARVP